MKSRYSKSFSVVGAVIVILSVGFLRVASGDTNENFKKQLLRIRSKGIEASTLKDSEALEAHALDLLKDHNTPTEKGMIHAAICLGYSAKGYSSSNERGVRLGKTIEYGKKALQNPLPDVQLSCRVHGSVAGAMFIKAREGPPERFAEGRREAIVTCLKGLKVALDNKAPRERPDFPPPMFVPHIITPNKGPKYQEAMAKYRKQLAEWERFRYLCKLYNERHALTSQCVTFYSEKPYDTEELREYAQKILAGYEDVVNDVVGQLEKRISTRKRRLSSSPKSVSDSEDDK
jgi:hypothetical protein